MELQTFKKNIGIGIEVILSIVFSIPVVVCALYASGRVFELTKGQNYSDVGVPMYTNGGGAALLGLIIYMGIVALIPLIIWKIKRSKIFIYIYSVINFFVLIFVLLIFMMLGI